jgi:hypothetical protein
MNEAWAEKVDQRLAMLEQFQAVEAFHRASVERRLGGIEDTLKRLLWLVVGAVVVGIVGFAMQGGLAI